MSETQDEAVERRLLGLLDDEWRSLKSLGIAANTRHLIAPAQRLAKRGFIEGRLLRNGSNLVYRRTAASETAQTGSVHDGPIPKGDAQILPKDHP